jgi:hypothetical protein
VAGVTVGINNGKLLKKLGREREIRRHMEVSKGEHTSSNTADIESGDGQPVKQYADDISWSG